MTVELQGTNPLTPPYWPEKVCSEGYFKRVVAATDTAYFAGGRKALPDVKTIAAYMGKTPTISKIAAVIGTAEFKKAMAGRGIEWSDKTLGITPEQAYALHIMTDPSTAHLQFNTRLKRAGVSYSKWSGWLKQPLFRTAFQQLTENLIDDNVGTAHTALVAKVASGDMRAIEFYYRLSGRFDPDKEAQTNMQAILLGILEILTRRITDTRLLDAISNDMEQLVTGEVVSRTLAQVSSVPADFDLDPIKAPVGEPPTVFSFEH